MNCPYCKNILRDENKVDEDKDDENTIIEVYQCPSCHKEPSRVYEFEEWRDSDGEFIREE